MIHAHCGKRLQPIPPDGRRLKTINGRFVHLYKCEVCGRKFRQHVRAAQGSKRGSTRGSTKEATTS